MAAAATLDEVKERGSLNCGVNTGLAGFAAPDANGNWEGFDVAFCRAVAAAVLGDPTAVEFVPLTGQTRFTALASGEVDVLSRNTTWTFSRDVDLKFEFAGVNYYDGQGFIVPTAARRDVGQGSRRRDRLHPDRHHDRTQPRRLLPRQQHGLRAGPDRDQRRGAAAVPGRRLRRLHDRRLRPRRDARDVREPAGPRHPARDHLEGAARARSCATATTTGATSSAGR